MSFVFQNELFPLPDKNSLKPRVNLERQRSGTFVDNLKLPVHRWYRYSAGFSAEWVCELIRSKNRENLRVLDPFVGSGTTLLAAESQGVPALGFETHPFVYRVARAKLSWNLSSNAFLEACRIVMSDAEKQKYNEAPATNRLLLECYSPQALQELFALQTAYLETRTDDPVWELVWLALTSILRSCSQAGTAQWQYVLPNKKKSKVLAPRDAFKNMIQNMSEDMDVAKAEGWLSKAHVAMTDARNPKVSEKDQYSLIITSPPYPNNYDYADATRLEMTFWGEISGWGDLQESVRQYLIRSCSQHSAAEKLVLDQLLEDALLMPIREDLEPVCRQLSKIRLDKGGKKTYHTMIAAYFLDLAKVWKALRILCKPGAEVCFVIGDSAPYGVYVPVDQWLGELAVASGFTRFRFEKIRDRNVKWKNRKHRVPLHEGRLWVYG